MTHEDEDVAQKAYRHDLSVVEVYPSSVGKLAVVRISYLSKYAVEDFRLFFWRYEIQIQKAVQS